METNPYFSTRFSGLSLPIFCSSSIYSRFPLLPLVISPLKQKQKKLDEHLAARTQAPSRQTPLGVRGALRVCSVLPTIGAASSGCSLTLWTTVVSETWDHCSWKPGKYSEVRPRFQQVFQRKEKEEVWKWRGIHGEVLISFPNWFSQSLNEKERSLNQLRYVYVSKTLNFSV